MSVIVVKREEDRIVIASDSQVTYSDMFKENIFDDKLFSPSKYLTIGGVGDARITSLLKSYCYTEPWTLDNRQQIHDFFKDFDLWCQTFNLINKEEEQVTVLNHSVFLIIYYDKIYKFDNHFLSEITEYTAIGSGAVAALAALILGHSVEEAINTACLIDNHCSLPVNIKIINGN